MVEAEELVDVIFFSWYNMDVLVRVLAAAICSTAIHIVLVCRYNLFVSMRDRVDKVRVLDCIAGGSHEGT